MRRLLCLALFGGALYAQSSQEYFDRGMSLARLNDLPQAAAVFEEGARLFPGDKRFPTELAGIAWREKNGSGAKRYLHTALKIDSADSYGNDFLASRMLKKHALMNAFSSPEALQDGLG
ncbi:MAG: hypothetical protein M3R43_11065 [Acidobacteriota bacterium]|nr:hypothetical protein [Acidobacteriota bacterium]